MRISINIKASTLQLVKFLRGDVKNYFIILFASRLTYPEALMPGAVGIQGLCS